MLEAMAGGATLEVTALWPLEVANALTVLQRRRKLTEEERQAGLGWLRRLPLHIDHEGSELLLGSDPARAPRRINRWMTPRQTL